VKYVIKWDLISILEEQRYDEPVGAVLEAVIVLTGSMGDAQALLDRREEMDAHQVLDYREDGYMIKKRRVHLEFM
jgi:hypothetical protein